MQNRQNSMLNRQSGAATSAEKMQSQELSGKDLQKLVAKSGHHHQLSTPTKTPVLNGNFQLQRQHTGVHLHTVDAHELENGYSSITLRPCLSITVILSGQLSFSLDGKDYFFDASEQPIGFAINCTKPVTLQRKLNKGQHIRKVNVAVSHDWISAHLDELGQEDLSIQQLLRQHIAVPSWLPGDQLQQLAQTLLESSNSSGILNSLAVESRAIEFIATCLQTLYKAQSLPASSKTLTLTNTKHYKAQKIKKFIDELIISDNAINNNRPDLSIIANQIGMSVSNLQRAFKQIYGQRVIEYIRSKKMHMALEALEGGNISIGEAAYIAGYKHTSNFALAFKKHFGLPPGEFIGDKSA